MHEANFELIDIPHLSQSGKNSADIRMVVDALDLCYTKNHLDVFVIISGDSDFSALVSKLRENNKVVIGVGVKNSTSELFVSNCDEFIFYDDLVMKKKKAERRKIPSRRRWRGSPVFGGRIPRGSERQDEAIDLVVETVESLTEESAGRIPSSGGQWSNRRSRGSVRDSMSVTTAFQRISCRSRGSAAEPGFDRTRGSTEKSGSYTVRG